jgi:hypothetical protein
MRIEKLIAGRWFPTKENLDTVENLDVRYDRFRTWVSGVCYEIYDKDPWTESFVQQPIQLTNKTLFPFKD